jgi:ABC-type multidrug transport system permease subunit
MKKKNELIKFIPIFYLVIFYLITLSSVLSVAKAQNDVSYIVLAVTTPLPLFIGIIIVIIKLIKEKNKT